MFRQAPLTATERSRRIFVPPDGFDELVAYASRGYNVLLIAPRGEGKTSALRQLELTLQEHVHPEDPVTAFVDLAEATTVPSALARLVSAAHAENRSRRSDDGEGAALLDALVRAPSTRFLVDNVDPQHVGYPLFGTFRDRLWDARHQFIVTVSTSDRGALLRPPADAFWEQILELTVTEEKAEALLTRRAREGAPWAGDLVAAIGPNPRRLLAAAQRVDAGLQSPDEVAADYRQRRAVVENQSTLAKRLVAELEDLGAVSASDDRLLRRVGASRPALDRGLKELEAAGLTRSYFEIDGPGRPRRMYELTGMVPR
jgi:hypothetical protein